MLEADVQKLMQQHKEEIERNVASHNEGLSSERESSESVHVQLQREAEEKCKILAQQLKGELEDVRAAIDELTAEATQKGETDREEIGVLMSQVQKAEEGLQQEQARSVQLADEDRLQAKEYESMLNGLSADSTSECDRLKLAIESAQNDVEDCMTQIRESRLQLTRRGTELENQRLKELDARSKRFDQETSTQELAHRSDLEASGLAAEAALEAERASHTQEVQRLQTDISTFEEKISGLRCYAREVEDLKFQVSCCKDENVELDAGRLRSQSGTAQEQQQEIASITQQHTMKLQLERV